MDRITEYQPLIKEALEEYAKLLNSPPKPPYQVMLAFDDEHQQYILRKMGWTKDVSGLRLHNRFSIYV